MKSVYVKFNDKDEIIKFVNTVCRYKGDFDIVNGRKIVDAKSFLGIMCLDLSDPLRLDIHNDGEENLDDLELYITNYQPKNNIMAKSI